MFTENSNIAILDREALTKIIRDETDRILAAILATGEKKPEKYLTRKQAASRLKISLPTLWKIEKNGQLPAHRIGAKVLFAESAIDAFLKNSLNN